MTRFKTWMPGPRPGMTEKNDHQNDLTRHDMKICVAGQGAFGQKHLDALKRIPEVEVTSLVGGNQDATAQVAKKYGVPHFTGELSEGIKRADAVILTTPTKLHFRQGEQVM